MIFVKTLSDFILPLVWSVKLHMNIIIANPPPRNVE